jgi:hypothetical protein
LKTKVVPTELCDKVRFYLNEQWTEVGSRNIDEEQAVIETLEPELK